MYNDFAIL